MQSVILAAGEGTRMKPLTNNMSTAMIPIANKPIIEWLIDVLSYVSDETIIVVNKAQKDIVVHFKGNSHCKFVYQEKLLGTANALVTAEKYIKGNFILLYGNEVIGKESIKKISRLKGYHFGTNETGLYLFDKKVFQYLGDNKELADVLEKMRKDGI